MTFNSLITENRDCGELWQTITKAEETGHKLDIADIKSILHRVRICTLLAYSKSTPLEKRCSEAIIARSIILKTSKLYSKPGPYEDFLLPQHEVSELSKSLPVKNMNQARRIVEKLEESPQLLESTQKLQTVIRRHLLHNFIERQKSQSNPENQLRILQSCIRRKIAQTQLWLPSKIHTFLEENKFRVFSHDNLPSSYQLSTLAHCLAREVLDAYYPNNLIDIPYSRVRGIDGYSIFDRKTSRDEKGQVIRGKEGFERSVFHQACPKKYFFPIIDKNEKGDWEVALIGQQFESNFLLHTYSLIEITPKAPDTIIKTKKIFCEIVNPKKIGTGSYKYIFPMGTLEFQNGEIVPKRQVHGYLLCPTRTLKGVSRQQLIMDNCSLNGKKALGEVPKILGTSFSQKRYLADFWMVAKAGSIRIPGVDKIQMISKMDLLRLGIPVVDLLQEIHGMNYIHSDLKPENIMIDAEQIGDFKYNLQAKLNDCDLVQRIGRNFLNLSKGIDGIRYTWSLDRGARSDENEERFSGTISPASDIIGIMQTFFRILMPFWFGAGSNGDGLDSFVKRLSISSRAEAGLLMQNRQMFQEDKAGYYFVISPEIMILSDKISAAVDRKVDLFEKWIQSLSSDDQSYSTLSNFEKVLDGIDYIVGLGEMHQDRLNHLRSMAAECRYLIKFYREFCKLMEYDKALESFYYTAEGRQLERELHDASDNQINLNEDKNLGVRGNLNPAGEDAYRAVVENFKAQIHPHFPYTLEDVKALLESAPKV